MSQGRNFSTWLKSCSSFENPSKRHVFLINRCHLKRIKIIAIDRKNVLLFFSFLPVTLDTILYFLVLEVGDETIQL